MSDKKQSTILASLHAELIADIESDSDEGLLREAKESGEDVQKVADAMRSCAREAAAAVLRVALSKAKAAPETRRITLPRIRPALEQLKSIVTDALRRQPDAALAFRDGKSLSDTDWQTLYDDLVLLGVITPSADED